VAVKNLFDVLSSKARNILYYGASVTVQKDGFRPFLHNLICEDTSQSHKEIVNGVGGVGSLFCAGNLNYVIGSNSEKIDLVIHECFTGDTNGGITSLELLPFFLEDFCEVFNDSEIVFVLNYRADRTFDELENVARIYESVASKYGVLVIPIYKDVHSGNFANLTNSDAFRDGVHPTPAGAEIIAKKIWSNIRSMPACIDFDTESSGLPRLANGKVEFINAEELAALVKSKFSLGNFIYKNTDQDFGYIEFESDFSFSIPQKNVLGFLALCGPKSPLFMNVSLDGKVRKFRTFDRNSFYTRPQTYAWPVFVRATQINFQFGSDEPDFSICTKFSDDFSAARSFKLSGIYVSD
jgi:hypothetical protein